MKISLPELDPNNIIYKLRDTDFVSFDHEMFVRPVKLTAECSTLLENIDKAIDIADREFARIAQRCGGLVLPHMWGVTDLDHERIFGLERDAVECGLTYYHTAFGKNRGLVAGVETIRTTSEERVRGLGSRQDMIQSRIHDYEDEMRGSEIPTDLRPDQFTFGTTRTITEPTIILHDIEPIINHQNC